MQELPPHSFTVFVPLVDFTLENGPTEFIPGGATPLTAATQLMPTGSNVYRRKVDGTDVQAEPMSPLPSRGRLLYVVHACDATAECRGYHAVRLSNFAPRMRQQCSARPSCCLLCSCQAMVL